jgi:hypothetical protein
VDYAELERRLAALGESVGDRLSDEQRCWLREFLDAGEYGIALEMVADWLSEGLHPITSTERAEANTLAQAMGNVERVMGPLALCPS